MAIYLKEFSTHSEYEAYITSEGKVLPNVSICDDTKDVHYNPLEPEPPVIPQLICTYYVDEEDIERDISLIYSIGYVGYGIRSMEVDGVVLNNVVDTYRFETPGEHIVKFTLSDNNSIIDRMFESCDSLTSIVIPNSVTSIGDKVFYNCYSLTSCTIGSGVTSIGNDTFNNCINLTSIVIPNSVTSIGDYTFYGCSRLTSVTIGSGVTNIGDDAFENNPWWNTYSADTSHHYGNVIYINNVAYMAVDSSIESAVIAEGTVAISDYVFANCASLTSITIPNSVTNIGINAFESTPWWNTYSADTSHHYGNVIYINNVAYMAVDSSIESAVIAEGTVAISDYVFANCASLTSITIPNSVTSIGASAFTNCDSLTSCTIGNGVTSIGDLTFGWCSYLTSIVIPNSVTSIGGSAFTGCYSLTSCTIGNGITSIGERAFYECSGFTSIVIPDSVTSIGSDAFSWCTSLTSCTIGSGVTSIGNYAFAWCDSLTSVTVEATTPPTLGDWVFDSNAEGRKIYVPAASVDTYKAAEGWSEYADDIEPIA